MMGEGGQGMGRNGPSDEAKAALGRLADALRDPDRRSEFRKDPHGTVPGYEQLPSSLRETFERLSDDELDLLIQAHDSLVNGGFYIDTDGGRLGFF